MGVFGWAAKSETFSQAGVRSLVTFPPFLFFLRHLRHLRRRKGWRKTIYDSASSVSGLGRRRIVRTIKKIRPCET